MINVIAFGGLGGNVFSAGLKTILMRLNGVKGIDFKTYEDWSSWRRWGGTLATWRDPTVMIAHSFGVPAAFGAARMLGGLGPKIPLVIAFDPSQYWWMRPSLWDTKGNAAPDNIPRVINFWQRAPFPFIGNQDVGRDNGSVRGIENVLVDNVIHGAIEDLPGLQERAVAEIRAIADRA